MALHDSNLRAYYQFETANDYTGNINLTNNAPGGGGTEVNFVAAKINNGANFEKDDGRNLSATSSPSAGVGFASSFTINVWFNLESQPALDTSMFIAARRTGGNGWGVIYEDVSTVKRWRVIIQGTDAAVNDASVSTATWYMMTFVYDIAGSVQIYKNGSSLGTVGSMPTNLQDASTNFFIGASSAAGGSPFDGILDEMGFWSRKLDATEITRLYNAGTGITEPFEVAFTASDTITMSDTFVHSYAMTFTDTITMSDTVSVKRTPRYQGKNTDTPVYQPKS